MRIRNPTWGLGGSSLDPNRILKFILVDDCEPVLDFIEAWIRRGFANVRILRFLDGEQAWQELVREEPDYLISDLTRPGVDGCELLRRLAQRRVKFPVLIVSGSTAIGERKARRCAGPDLNVSFLPKPFEGAEFLSILNAGLAATAMNGAPASHPLTRPLRIIHVDDESCILQVVGIIMRGRAKHLELLQFQSSVTAWWMLSKFEPDLLITDDGMPVISGGEIVKRLVERKATYPIMVISAWHKTEAWVQEYADQGLRITHLSNPFDISTFFEHLTKHLGPLEPPAQGSS